MLKDFWSMRNPFYWVVFIAAWSLASYVLACSSTGKSADRTVLEHQQQITELEARNADLTRRLAQYDSTVTASVNRLTSIRERAVGATATVIDIINLFNDYQREVEQLLSGVMAIQTQTGEDG